MNNESLLMIKSIDQYTTKHNTCKRKKKIHVESTLLISIEPKTYTKRTKICNAYKGSNTNYQLIVFGQVYAPIFKNS